MGRPVLSYTPHVLADKAKNENGIMPPGALLSACSYKKVLAMVLILILPEITGNGGKRV